MKTNTKPLLILMLGLLLSPATGVQAADVPEIMAYQGRIAVSGSPFNGTGQFKFALVNGDGSATYWSNDGTSAAGSEPTDATLVAVQGGLFSVLLGDTDLPNMTAIPASVFANDAVYLRIWFNDGVNGWQLLSPDRRLAAAGWAMQAQDSNRLGGQTAAFYRDASNLDAGTVPVARLPVATGSTPGAVQPDGSTLTIDGSGVLSVATAAPSSHASTHAPDGSDPLPWTTIHGAGLASARPTAAAGNAGYLYLSTDVNGGTLYRSDGSSWTQVAPGVSEAGSGGDADTLDTLDSTDLLARANHTGTQTAATISDFGSAADARIGAASVTDLSDVAALDTDLSSVSASDDTLASAKAIKAYVDSVGETARIRTLYVGKHGDDANAGTTPSEPFLTFAAALSAASSLTPASDDRVAIIGTDAGRYVEDLTGVASVDIIAPQATLVCATATTGCVLADDSTWHFHRLETADTTAGSGDDYNGFEFHTANGRTVLKAQQFYKPDGADLGSYATRVTRGELVISLGTYGGQPGICDTYPDTSADAKLTFTAESVELISSSVNGWLDFDTRIQGSSVGTPTADIEIGRYYRPAQGNYPRYGFRAFTNQGSNGNDPVVHIRGGSFIFEETGQPLFVADGADSDSNGFMYVDVARIESAGDYARTEPRGHMRIRTGSISGTRDIRSNSSIIVTTPDGVLSDGTATTFSIDDTTTSTSKDTGALVVEGGVGVEKAMVAGERVVAGQLTLTTGTFSGQTVTAANTVLLDTSGGSITIDGFADGIAGQTLTLVKTSSSNSVTLNHNNGGTQPIILQAGSGSLTMAASTFGGITLICDGTNWYDASQAATYAP